MNRTKITKASSPKLNSSDDKLTTINKEQNKPNDFFFKKIFCKTHDKEQKVGKHQSQTTKLNSHKIDGIRWINPDIKQGFPHKK